MKKFTLLVFIVLITVLSYAQGHFVPASVGNGTDHMNINALTATIGGIDLEVGDEIAIFDGTICCGVKILTQPIDITDPNTFADIAASKADAGLSNGYTTGHTITYKLWDSSKNKEISVISAEYYDKDAGLPTVTIPTFAAGESAFVKLTGTAPVNQLPVSNAGPDQTLNEDDNGTLDGTASSDVDSDPLTYLWTAPAGITLSSLTAAQPTFTAPEVTIDTDYKFSLVVNDGKANSPADEVIITVKQVNKVPTANAGIIQSVNEGEIVTLDGTGSTDGDSDALTYLWTAPAGVTLSSATASKPTFTAPEVTIDTDYTFSLIVNDGKANSPADDVIITVKQVNKAPIANAGTDQSVDEGVLVTLDGTSSSDPDSDVLTYLWTAPAGVSLSSATASKPTFTAPEVTIDTDYKFSLVVNDGKADSPADEVMITVKQVNKVPTANAGIDQSVNEGVTVTLDGTTSTDPEGDALTYLWTAPAGITLSSATDSKPTFTAPEVTIDTEYTITLVVNDGKADSPANQVIITVKQVNKAPVANAGLDQAVYENILFTLDGSGSSDPDNNTLTYLWTAPAGITLSSTTVAKPTFTAPTVLVNTNYTFTLVVNDGTLDSPSNDVTITVKLGNKTPVANAGIDQTENEGVLVTLDGTASSDPDNDLLSYLWTAPAEITLSSTTASKPTFTAPEVTADTDYKFTLVVNDGTINSTADEVMIKVKQVNKAPVASAGTNQSANELTLVTLDGSASSDFDTDPLTYAWTAPAGITLSSLTDPKPTFTAPEVSTDTDFAFSLVVNDELANSTADEVIVTVKQVNKAPVANAGPDQAVDENSMVTLDGSASSDFDIDPLTYTWTAPAGITLSSLTDANPTFTAPEVNANTNYTFTLVVNDGTANSTADVVIVTVKQVNKSPVANAGTDVEVTERKIFQLDGSFSSDFDNDLLTYKWTEPAGITLNSTTVAKPTFTAPDVIANTDYTFSLVVSDGNLDSPADEVVITVIPNKAPVANAGPDQTVAQKQKVTLNGSLSSDPENDAITYLWSVPAGITLINPNSANPSFDAPLVLADTDFSIKLKVNDGDLDSPEDEVIIHVLSNQFPIVNAGADFSVNEGNIATIDGSASYDPEGNSLTYTWTGPAGLALMNSTSSNPSFWAPEVAQDYQYLFTLVVGDGTNISDPDYIVVTVKQVNKAPVARAGANQSIDEGLLVKLDGSLSSDHDNNPLTYSWTAPEGITLSSSTVSKPTFTAPEVMADTDFIISLVVNDGTVNSTASEVLVTVKQVNRAPVANAGDDFSVNEGQLATIDGTASTDPDNNTLTYLWTAPDGVTSTTTGKFTFTAPEVQSDTQVTLSLVVNDGFVNSAADQVVITIKQVNKAPVSKAGSDQSVNELVVVALDGSPSTDPDNDALTYLWTAPTGITLSSTTAAKPTFTAPEVSVNTNYTFSLIVNDGTVNSLADQIVVTVKNVDHAPYVKDSIKNVSVDKRAPDQVIDLKTVFADDDFGDVLSFSVSSNTNDKVVVAKITGSNLTLTFSTLNTGLSQIVITATSNGKESISKFNVEVKIPTGIDPNIEDSSVQIYPNPTKGNVQLNFSNTPQSGIWITVYSISGKIISKSLVNNKEEYLNLKGNPAGLYFIKIDQKTPKTYKLVLE